MIFVGSLNVFKGVKLFWNILRDVKVCTLDKEIKFLNKIYIHNNSALLLFLNFAFKAEIQFG
jgi:hypothetical protein